MKIMIGIGILILFLLAGGGIIALWKLLPVEPESADPVDTRTARPVNLDHQVMVLVGGYDEKYNHLQHAEVFGSNE